MTAADRRKYLYRGIVALFIVAIAMMMLQRMNQHLLIGDELRYCYRFDLKEGETYFRFQKIRPVETLQDVGESMVNHYEYVNGRLPVHATEQIFSCLLDIRIFYILNTLVFLLALWQATILTTRYDSRWRMLPIVAVAFLYLFPVPGRLWLSINLSLNYLWPSVAMMLLLPIAIRLARRGSPTPLQKLLVIILSFLFGWSNEAFSFPFAGMLILFMLKDALKTRRIHKRGEPDEWKLRFDRKRVWFVMAPLLAGVIVMGCSPGNWQRAGVATDIFGTYLNVLLELRIIWLLIITVVAMSVFRKGRRFLRNRLLRPALCQMLLTTLLISLVFGIVAHTASRSMTGIELISLLLLLRLIPQRFPLWISIAVMALAVVHQTAVTFEHKRHWLAIHNAVERYRTDGYGTVAYDYRPSPWYLEPFVYSQIPANEGADYEWRLLGISVKGYQGYRNAPFMPLTPDVIRRLPELGGKDWKRVGPGYMRAASPTAPIRRNVIDTQGDTLLLTRTVFNHQGKSYWLLMPPIGKRLSRLPSQL